MHHYRCYTVFVPKTKTEHITDTITFLPTTIPILKFDAETQIQQTLKDILQLIKIKKKKKTAIIYRHYHYKTPLQKLSEQYRTFYIVPPHSNHPRENHLIYIWYKKYHNTTRQKNMQTSLYRIAHHRGCKKLRIGVKVCC